MQADENLVPVYIAADVADDYGTVVLHAGDLVYVPAPKDLDPADDVIVHPEHVVYVVRGEQQGDSREKGSNGNHELARAVGRGIGRAGAAGKAAGEAAGKALAVASGAAAAAGSVAAAAGSAALNAAGSAAEAAGGAVKAAGEAIRERSQAKSVPEAVAEEAAEFSAEQAVETEEFAREFIRKLLRVKVVRIDREDFLSKELYKKGIDGKQVIRAVEDRPAAAGIPRFVLDRIAEEAIALEVKQAAGTSFVSGLPGGWAIVATIPADLTQYYAHVFRLIQKLAYIYGWPSFFDELDEVTDETLYELLAFFSVSMGVEGAGTTLTKFAVKTAEPAVAKHVAAKALTKTAWYLPLKRALNYVGVSITKDTVGKAAGKVVPVLGGFVSGGITFVTLKQCGGRLKEHLATLPQADPNMEARAKQMAVEYMVEDI